MSPRSPSSCGSVRAMAEAALVMTLKVPITFSCWMNSKAPRSWGEPSRLMTRPTQPVPAQFTAIRRLPPVGRLVDRPLAVLGIGDVAGHVVGRRSPRPRLLGPVLVAVEDGAPATPCAARARAVAAPRPEAPPVMIADIPLSSMAAMRTGAASSSTSGARSGIPPVPSGPPPPPWRPTASSSTTSFQRSPEWPFTQREARPTARVEGQLEQRLPQVPVGHRLALACSSSPAAASRPTSGAGSS